METIHPFEEAGLGLAPFRLAGFRTNVLKTGQPGGTCNYCYNGIKYECVIRSHDGKTFVVGTDCVMKLGRDDNRLLAAVKREIAKAEAAKRAAKREAAWKEQQAKREAELQAQRDRNGGLTDREVEAAARAAEAERVAVEMREKNAWLIGKLRAVPYASGFVDSILRDLERFPAGEVLGGRAKAIVRDIVGKLAGRRGSKANVAAEAEFDSFIAKTGG